jgi:hypothetical protein
MNNTLKWDGHFIPVNITLKMSHFNVIFKGLILIKNWLEIYLFDYLIYYVEYYI